MRKDSRERPLARRALNSRDGSLSINDLQHLPGLEPAGREPDENRITYFAAMQALFFPGERHESVCFEDQVGAQCCNYNARCTRTTVASPGTRCTVNLSFRAKVSIGTLSAITEPSIVL